MGQGDILEFLEKQFKISPEKYFTKDELCKALNVGNCSEPLRKLRMREEVEYRKRAYPSPENKYPLEYKHKIKKKIMI